MDSIMREEPHATKHRLHPLLCAADEDDEVVRTTLADAQTTGYGLWLGAENLIGAALMRWDNAASEIIYIAVAPEYQHQGHAKHLLRWLQAEAHRQGTTALLVGTGNSSFDTIALYQKCGFRIDHVRRDFFAYIQPPISENGIPLRDMLVLRYAVE